VRELYVQASGIFNGAGQGLFINEWVKSDGLIGHFYGAVRCAACVKEMGLHQTQYKFNCLEVDRGMPKHGISACYYQRTHVEAVDGWMWYINSSSKSNWRAEHKQPNVYFVACGFDAEGTPLLEVRAFHDLAPHTELLAMYFAR
jgi:hypothetical protein